MIARLDARRAVVLVSTVVAVAAALTGVGQPWQAAAVFWFVAVIPGLALQPWLGVAEPLARVVLAVAVSLALAVIASEGLAIAGAWSPVALMATLATASLAGCALGKDPL